MFKAKKHLITMGCWFIVFMTAYFFMSHIAERVQADVGAHVSFIPLMLAGTKKIPHFLWHALVFSTSRLIGQSYFIAALWVSALSISVITFIKYGYFSRVLNSVDKTMHPLFLGGLCAVSMILMPIYIPFFNPNLYLGQGGVGVWHNPTLLILKPWAFLSVFLVVRFVEKNEPNVMWMALAVTLISILAKPNYILILMPALVSWMVWVRWHQSINSINLVNATCFISVLFLMSILVLAMQFYVTYLDPTEGHHIGFRNGVVWNHYTPSVGVSIVTALAFPMLVGLANKRPSHLLQLSWLLVFYGLLEAYFLVELNSENQVLYDWNFFWGYLCATDVLFTVSIVHYVAHYVQYKKVAMLGNALLFLHAVSGLIYLKHLLIDQSFL